MLFLESQNVFKFYPSFIVSFVGHSIEYVDKLLLPSLTLPVRKGLEVAEITFRRASSFGSTKPEPTQNRACPRRIQNPRKLDNYPKGLSWFR
jgi:hypothetical protein